MNNFKAEILADSKNPQGDRITTMKVTFPRFILAEFNTHRMFSRNSASSRAIPFKKMVKMVEENPFVPIAWQRDHKGMQGSDYITEQYIIDFKKGVWLNARNKAVQSAEELHSPMSKATSVFHIEELKSSDVTKQLCNRLLEPFMWHTVIVTATEWENFFKLRCPQYESPSGEIFKSKRDYSNKSQWSGCEKWSELDWLGCNKSQAEIHIQAIAELMWDAMNESTPKQLQSGQWHVPFGDNINEEALEEVMLKLHIDLTPYNMAVNQVKVATARCARISYETLGDNPKIDYEADLKLHDILVKNGHASPLEHCALATNDSNWYGNFKGWNQYRKILESQSLL
jgi:thymidylate synthase ThyX